MLLIAAEVTKVAFTTQSLVASCVYFTITVANAELSLKVRLRYKKQFAEDTRRMTKAFKAHIVIAETRFELYQITENISCGQFCS